jgi:hypothetical protein
MSPAPDRLDTITGLSQPFTDTVKEIVRQHGNDRRFAPGFVPLGVRLGFFPNGGCRFASILFALILRRRDIITTLVTGWQCPKCDEYDECVRRECKARREHTWLEYDGCVIDLTRCQFGDFPERPFISHGSDWHSSRRILDRKELTSLEVGNRGELVDEIERGLALLAT